MPRSVTLLIFKKLYVALQPACNMPFYCPHPDCRQKCKSNRGVRYHLNHNPKCRTITPYYHLKFQTGLSNKFQTPTAKKQRTLDTKNSPFRPPPKFTNETYLEEEGCITASSYDEQVPGSKSPTLLDTAELINIFPTDEENQRTRSLPIQAVP